MSDLQKKDHVKSWLLSRPWTAGIFVFLLLSSICFYIASQRYHLRRNEDRLSAMNMAESVKSRLQQSLYYSISATQALTLIIDKEGIPHNFDSIAARILQSNKYIDALQLVPGGVIRYIYPLNEHQVAIGYNILADSARNREAYKAIERKELFFAGPFTLRQGGTAIVGRLPFFIGDKFWGFSAVIIRMSTLLDAIGIDTSGRTGYYFQLSKINPETGKEEFFLPEKMNAAANSDLAVSVSIPNGEWKLSVSPVEGNKAIQSIIAIGTLGFMLSVLGALFAVYLAKTPSRLQKMVLDKTSELEKSEKRNKAIVNALPDMAFVIDKEGRFTDYNNPLDQKTYIPREQFIGKKVHEVMPPDLAREFQHYLAKALTEKQLCTHSYQLQINHEIMEYEARYISQNNEDVLVVVRDMTEAKKAEQRIKESEHKYRTLVEQAADGIFIADFSGNILVVNPAGCKLSQYSEEEILKMKVQDFTTLEQLEAMPLKFEDIAAGKTTLSERKMRKKNGELIDVEITAKIIAPNRFQAFVRDITERKKAALEILKSREDLRRLTNYIENVREEERLSIAREIHDELGQQLTVLKMDIARIGKKLTVHDETCQVEINEAVEAINKMVDVVRKISSDLRPGLLDDLGLIAALDWYCNDFGKRTGIKTSFIPAMVEDDKLPKKITIAVFRILQDSLANVGRHSDARKTDVSLVVKDDQLVLLIEDNGKGFNADDLKNKSTLGIMGMKERALMIGGVYNVYSNPGKGTIIEVMVPLVSQKTAPL